MQITYEQDQRSGLLQAFAGRNNGYMMRSEKRPDPYGNGGGRMPGGRPPRRRKAGVPYIILTLLVSIILWPIGMVMLWRRKVRMQAGTKLLISLLTLCISVFLIVFALTVPVENAQFTAFQDRANDWLTQAENDIAVAADATVKKSSETWAVMTDFADAGSKVAAGYVADGLDKGVELAGRGRAAVNGLLHPNAKPAATAAPTAEAIATASPEPTDEAAVAPTEPTATKKARKKKSKATPEPTDEVEIQLPEATPDAADAQPLEAGTLNADGSFAPDATDAPTDAPAETANAALPQLEAAQDGSDENTALPEVSANNAGDDALPEVAAAADAALPEMDAATEAPTAEPTAAPTPEPTEAPTPEPPAYEVKAAGDATVYFFPEGKGYHIDPDVHDMGGAPARTLAEGIAAGKNACQSCQMPGAEVLEIEHVCWVDEDHLIHTTDDCEAFRGRWTLMPLEDAIAAGYEACAGCGADLYAQDICPAPTPTPAPKEVSPATPLKDAGKATVYYYDASKGYHIASDCTGMNGAPAHTLAEAVAAGKHACGNCNPPDETLIGLPVLWMDEKGRCHTSDECAKFKGQYTLIARDDALAQGLKGCKTCGANEYLVAGTVLKQD